MTMIEYGKDWLLQCFEDDYDQEQIEELTDSQVLKSVGKYWDGGLKDFEATYALDYPELAAPQGWAIAG